MTSRQRGWLVAVTVPERHQLWFSRKEQHQRGDIRSVLTAENKKKQKIPFSFFSFRVLETLMVPHCHSVMADWDLHVTFYTLSCASIPAVRSSAGLHIETHEHSHLPVGANSEWPMNLTRMSLDFRKKPQCLDTQTQWWKHADPAQNRKQPHVSSV